MATDPDSSVLARTISLRERLRRLRGESRRINHAWWALAVFFLIGVFLWHQRGEIAQTIIVLRTARIGWAVALLLSALGMHVIYALTLSTILARLGSGRPSPPPPDRPHPLQPVGTGLDLRILVAGSGSGAGSSLRCCDRWDDHVVDSEGRASIGSSSVKMAPPFCALSTVSEPPWARARRALM